MRRSADPPLRGDHEPGGEQGARRAGNQVHRAEELPRFAHRHVMRSLKKSGRPPHQSPAPESGDGNAQQKVKRGALRLDEAQRGANRCRLQRRRVRIELPTARLAHREPHQQGNEQPGNTQHEKGGAPTMAFGDLASDGRPQPRAQASSECENRQRHRPARRGKFVGQYRGRRRSSARLPDADAKAAQQQLPVILGQSARGRHGRPYRQRHSEDVAAIRAVGERRDWNSDRDIEQRERYACKKRHAAVRKIQLVANGLEKRGDREPVRDVERIHDGQHAQHVPAVAGQGATQWVDPRPLVVHSPGYESNGITLAVYMNVMFEPRMR